MLFPPAEAEDVAQETLRRVLAALEAGRVANLEALPGFVFQTARHLCLHGYPRRTAPAFHRANTGASRPTECHS